MPAFSSSPGSPLSSISPLNRPRNSHSTSTLQISGSKFKFGEIEQTHLRLLGNFKTVLALRLNASREPSGLTRELTKDNLGKLAQTENGPDMFNEMKHRFMSFKKQTYVKNLQHFQNLANGQAPKVKLGYCCCIITITTIFVLSILRMCEPSKISCLLRKWWEKSCKLTISRQFLVIACADSRVCPSYILGLQPGEAFMVRNVANLVPPFERGPTETNAALEFAVNSLEVENILVIGHSCCGGIRALMSMRDEIDTSSFLRSWVFVGKNARLSTKAAASNLSFDQQCRHCEKESINSSLLNLLSYPWIEERVAKGVLSIHGGYYNFVDCTFEKWTIDYKGGRFNEKSVEYSVKQREFWS